jgi:polyferredoxin
MMATTQSAISPSENKPKYVKRTTRDHSQRTRFIVQGLFLFLNLWLGLQFYIWVLAIEHGILAHFEKPAGVEGWLPIAGLMNAKYFLMTGHVPDVHPAAMFLFLAFVVMSLLLKRAFCSWLCPVGSVSEFLWKSGRRLFRGNVILPRWLDIPLRGLKYLLLGFFVFVIGMMSADALVEFMHSPYAVVADVKMLNFFRHMGLTAGVVMLLLVVGSVFIKNLWCRYLCPYGALLGLVSVLSPVKIRRDTEACIACGKCARVCPAQLKVDKLVQITSVECNACMECVAACASSHALQFALMPARKTALSQRWTGRVFHPWMLAGALAFIFFAFVLYARATHHWQTNISPAVYQDLVLNSDNIEH